MSNLEVTLGEYLRSIREDRKMTLRGVEEATDKEVSNAYLSQIENDKIKKPSPNILHAIAELYGISFEGLMSRAGFLTPPRPKETEARHGRVATFAEHDLTPDEEAELMQYLRFIRTRERPGDKTG